MLGVVAQRLVRRVCEKCKRPITPPADLAAALGIDPTRGSFQHGAGCRACSGTGYRGRVGIFEVLEVDEEIQALISQRAPAEEIARSARRAGMRTLREDAVRKAGEGLTTLEEVLRVTKRDMASSEDESAALRAGA